MERCEGSPFRVISAGQFPIGRAVAGGNPAASPALVTSGGCSSDLMNRGPKKRRYAGTFLDYLNCLGQQGVAASVLVHWCRGDIATEKVEVREKRKILLAEFRELFPDKVDEDVRYVVFAEMPGHQGLTGRTEDNQ